LTFPNPSTPSEAGNRRFLFFMFSYFFLPFKFSICASVFRVIRTDMIFLTNPPLCRRFSLRFPPGFSRWWAASRTLRGFGVPTNSTTTFQITQPSLFPWRGPMGAMAALHSEPCADPGRKVRSSSARPSKGLYPFSSLVFSPFLFFQRRVHAETDF